MKHSKKKKRVRTPRQSKVDVNGNGDGVGGVEDEQSRAVASLAQAFSSISMERVALAYGDAGRDANKAAEILGGLLESSTDPSSSGWSSSERGFDFSGDDPSSSSTSSERLTAEDVMQLHVRGKGFGGHKQRKSVASVGMVSGVIGRDYLTTNKRFDHAKRCDSSALKGLHEAPEHNGEVEQFLWSMLGEECELSMETVRDVLGQCGYNVEKALDVLLDLSMPLHNKDGNWSNYASICEKDSRTFLDHADSIDGRKGKSQLADRTSDSMLHLSEQELQQFLQSSTHDCSTTAVEQGLPQKVLESLFNIPKRSELEVESMNWKNIVNKMDSIGERLDLHPPTVAAKLQQSTNCGMDEEYQRIRMVPTERYDAMKSCYLKAATAYSRGEKGYAAFLSEQGRIQNKMAKEADERASQEIFRARNRGIQNVVTIDLHGQHVQQAIRILKVHLLIFSTYIFSVRFLRVITGCGGHGVGTGKVKQSVIGLLKRECVEWTEENQGSMLIKLDGRRNFSFMESGVKP